MALLERRNMDENVIKEIGEMIISVAEANAAVIDALTLICIHLQDSEKELSSNISTVLKNIRDQNQFEVTDSLVRLCDCLSMALDGNPDTSFLSIKKTISSPTSPEELRKSLHLILCDKS